MKVIGVDPGLDGALALWDGQVLTVISIPSVKAASRGREVNWAILVDAFDCVFSGADHAFVERVGAMPGQGVSSMFKFGFVAGGVRGVLAAHRVPVTYVVPTKWKREMGVGAAKESSVARACELFPTMAELFRGRRGGSLSGPAEAALIALYGYHSLTGVLS